MATLGNVNGGSLTPDLSNPLNMLLQTFGTKQQREGKAAQQAQQSEIQNLAGSIPSLGGVEQEKALARLASINPDLAKIMNGVIERGDEQERAQILQETENKLKESIFISKQETYQGKINAITNLAQQQAAEGNDISHLVKLGQMPEEQLDLELQKAQILGQDVKSLTAAPKKTSLMQNVEASGLVPGTPEYEQAIRNDIAGIKSKERLQQDMQVANAGRATTNVNVGGSESAPPVITPPELLVGLPDEVSTKLDAVYRAAGGGKDGLDAINKLSDKLSEQDRRSQSDNILKASFPQATPEEFQQLKSSMDAADSTESGLKQAQEVRSEQRRVKKAKGFQGRAISLLNKIISNPQLSDVTGSLEGSYDTRLFSDGEAELIADIEEAGNILTADNLDLMSGVLSETDIGILKSLASGGLNRKRTTDRFISDVKQMISKMGDGAEGSEKIGRFVVKVK